VNSYFNELTGLKGSFIQTSADNKRQHGKFYIMRPGRFRFEYARPSMVVILSDGKYIDIQDHDLKTDDRWDLSNTPFRALLQKHVDLLQDARIVDVQETDDTIVVSFEDLEASSRITLFLAIKPSLQVRAWITKDAQGLDTRIDVADLAKTDDLDPALFDPASGLDRTR
jgi:outer membrane lipoprotein-sorting protein